MARPKLSMSRRQRASSASVAPGPGTTAVHPAFTRAGVFGMQRMSRMVVTLRSKMARDALECETGGDGDNQGVFAHCVADLGDHFRKELGLHSEHQHIGGFGNLAIAGGDGDAELFGLSPTRGLGFSRADDVGGGDHSHVAVFAAERCVLAQQASDNGRGHVS